ncbi:phage antirepressor KilAC domain-containing protein (plasmid) [Hymenobacter tibetensis]|uniref:Phage antirepressor KilAC domain-containing protein n=1 Tax=Hymenobacter tibetensis TaxID=497967 RepID=A0ABY4D658_9BACT|nr:phage antirepressor KilAC domain-containing protein [Hymenobacter tibetensis]UOG77657.1 phage antirepressor KilAC domain-containing protein [Hymenobacter tibetensis]
MMDSQPATPQHQVIQLPNGHPTNSAKLQRYFTTILQAERTGELFPVLLDHVWPIGYARKDGAVKALRSKFTEGHDYQSYRRVEGREVGATTVEIFQLSISCAEYLVVRGNREVFELYRQARQAIQQMVNTHPLPTNYADALRQLAEKVENNEKLEQQLQQETRRAEAAFQESQRVMQLAEAAHQVIQQQAESVAIADFLTASNELLTLQQAANMLPNSRIGQNKLYKLLIERDVVIKKSGTPYAKYKDYFEVKYPKPHINEYGRTHCRPRLYVKAVKGMALLRRLLG